MFHQRFRTIPSVCCLVAVLLCTVACRKNSSVPPTPVGLVGAPFDLRAQLPAAFAPPDRLDPARAYGHVLRLGSRGNNTVLRFLTWLGERRDPAGTESAPLAGFAVEVTENPHGCQVRWRASNVQPQGARLRVVVSWLNQDSIEELEVSGQLSAEGGLFRPD